MKNGYKLQAYPIKLEKKKKKKKKKKKTFQVDKIKQTHLLICLRNIVYLQI